jgi:hypothetical protein
LVTGIGAGSTTITATTVDGAKIATTAITVTIAVTGVSVSPTTSSITTGSTQQLTATIAPADATNQAIVWSSSNSAVANVSGTGLVTGIGAGSTTITATTVDGSKIATTAITVTIAVTGVSVSPNTSSITTGSTQQLTATVAPANATNKSVVWSSSNSAVATVSSTGLVTGVGAGSTTITVTTVDGSKIASTGITVTLPAPIVIEAESYSTMSGVGLFPCSEGGQLVGSTDVNDYMDYIVNLPAGMYTINYRIASPYSNGKIQVRTTTGTFLSSNLSVPNTGGWSNWITISTTLTLQNSGIQTIRLFVSAGTRGGSYNLNWFSITSSTSKMARIVKLENSDYTSNLSVFPNPVSDILYIETGSKWDAIENVEIFNINGAKIGNRKLEKSSSSISWNLGDLNLKTDIYLIHVKTKQSSILKKIIVK